MPVRLVSSPGADWCKALLRWSDRRSHKLKRERRQKFWWKTRPGWFRNLVTFFRLKFIRRLWPFIVSRGSCTYMGSVLLNKVNRKSWTLQPSALNMSIKLGTTNTHRIDLALKMRSCDIISPMHCLTSLSILAELSYDQGTFSATWICLLFRECPTLFCSLRLLKMSRLIFY